MLIPNLGAQGGPTYNNTLSLLIGQLLPNGMLGIAITGLLAAFMAGMAANVSSFNTVFTYDIWEPYVQRHRPDDYYLRFGRFVTLAGVVVAIFTAFLASHYNNIMDYIQLLFSFFNAPLFATFIIGMFWKRMTPWAGFFGLLAGTLGAATVYYLNEFKIIGFSSPQAAAFYGAAAAFVADAVVSVVVSLVTRPKEESSLCGLVWSLTPKSVRQKGEEAEHHWYRSPALLGGTVLAGTTLLTILFA